MTTTTVTATAQAAKPVTSAARPAKTEIRPPKALPAPNSDFYQLADVLTAEEKAIVKKVRTYMETRVQPIINKYWSDDAFPFELLPSFRELGLGGVGYEGYGCAGGSQKLFGFVANGAGTRRRFVLYVLRRAQRAGNGFDLSRWIGGAETQMAAADGALGKDRLLRPHRAPGGVGNERRNDHDR
jgi:hypothetical protein